MKSSAKKVAVTKSAVVSGLPVFKSEKAAVTAMKTKANCAAKLPRGAGYTICSIHTANRKELTIVARNTARLAA